MWKIHEQRNPKKRVKMEPEREVSIASIAQLVASEWWWASPVEHHVPGIPKSTTKWTVEIACGTKGPKHDSS
jgi:hypothetical protein